MSQWSSPDRGAAGDRGEILICTFYSSVLFNSLQQVCLIFKIKAQYNNFTCHYIKTQSLERKGSGLFLKSEYCLIQELDRTLILDANWTGNWHNGHKPGLGWAKRAVRHPK